MKTLIAIPCHDMVHAKFMQSFAEMQKPEGTAFAVITSTLIYTARNLIAQNAVKHGFDRVLWLDSDMIIPEDALIRLGEDIDQGLDYVSGLAFMRKLPTKPVIYSDITWKVKNGEVETGATNFESWPDGLFEIAGSGFGCCMTSVRLLQKMIEQCGSPFSPLMGMGEDTSFCWRVANAGIKMYCDSRVKCGHIGTMIFDEASYDRTRTNN